MKTENLCHRLMARECRGRTEQAMMAASRLNLPRMRMGNPFLLLTDSSMDSRIASNYGGCCSPFFYIEFRVAVPVYEI
jgi:hypothetical protein